MFERHEFQETWYLPQSCLYRLSQKYTIGLSASIVFKILNQSEYTLGL